MALAQKKTSFPFRVSPMLATLLDRPFHNRIGSTREVRRHTHLGLQEQRVFLPKRQRTGKRLSRHRTMNLSPPHCCWTARLLFLTQTNSRFQLLRAKRPTQYAVFRLPLWRWRDLRREVLPSAKHPRAPCKTSDRLMVFVEFGRRNEGVSSGETQRIRGVSPKNRSRLCGETFSGMVK